MTAIEFETQETPAVKVDISLLVERLIVCDQREYDFKYVSSRKLAKLIRKLEKGD